MHGVCLMLAAVGLFVVSSIDNKYLIVIPMLIHSLTFGPVYQNLLGDDPGDAIRFAGVSSASRVC